MVNRSKPPLPFKLLGLLVLFNGFDIFSFLIQSHNLLVSSPPISWRWLNTCFPPCGEHGLSPSFGETSQLRASSSPAKKAFFSLCGRSVTSLRCRVFGARCHTCSLAPAAVAAQSQSPCLITQSLRNKETGNVNQPAWQLQRRSTPLRNKHHSN